jgi:hypothetical protein
MLFSGEATAGQSAYILLTFIQKNKILVFFFSCFLLYLPIFFILTLNSLLLTEEFSFKRKITLLSIIK